MYYDKTEIEIHSGEEFIFSITYRDPKEFEMEDEGHRQGVSTKSAPSQHQVSTKSALSQQEIKKILLFCSSERYLIEILNETGTVDRTKFRRKYITPLLNEGLLAMTVPDKPNSRLQRYYTTKKGKELLGNKE
jgi:ATP-dependent DNA helicase RecG